MCAGRLVLKRCRVACMHCVCGFFFARHCSPGARDFRQGGAPGQIRSAGNPAKLYILSVSSKKQSTNLVSFIFPDKLSVPLWVEKMFPLIKPNKPFENTFEYLKNALSQS